MDASDECYYGILQVSHTASEDEIRHSYKTLARRYHPDRRKSSISECGANPQENVGEESEQDMFSMVARAYEVLGDSTTREAYNLIRGHSTKQLVRRI